MADKIGFVIGRIIIYLLGLALIAIIAVASSAIVNRLLIWGFPSYGC